MERVEEESSPREGEARRASRSSDLPPSGREGSRACKPSLLAVLHLEVEPDGIRGVE